MAKLNGEEAMDITSHSDDLVFKEALTVFKDHSLDFLGLDLPKIVEPIDTTLAEIEAREWRPDRVFWLADRSILHLESESQVSKKDFFRFTHYDLLLAETYEATIHTVVLTKRRYNKRLAARDFGAFRYSMTVLNLTDWDGEALYRDLREKVSRGETVNPLELAFLPLMRSETRDKNAVVRRTADLARRSALPPEFKREVLLLLIVLCDKFISRETMAHVWEEIEMLKIIKFAMDKGRNEGRNEGKVEGKAEGFMDACLANLRSLMETARYTAQQAMDALRIPADQREMYARLLAAQ